MDDNTYTLYESYFNGELNPEESLEFEARLKNDPVFKKEYKAFTDAVMMIQSKDMGLALEADEEISAIRANFKKKLDTLPEEEEDKVEEGAKIVKFNRTVFLKRIAAAAAIIIALFVGYQMQNQENPLDNEALLAELDIADENRKQVLELIGTPAQGFALSEKKALQYSLDFYHKKQYPRAIQDLKDYTNSGATYAIDTAFYYLGESYRESGNHENAIASFNKIKDNSELFNRKHMSLLLTYLHQKKTEEALQEANIILANQDTSFQTKARKYVKALNK